jgi:predicted nucleic acid-binding protein
MDFLIASTAISQGVILVSNDGIFENIVELGFQLNYQKWV